MMYCHGRSSSIRGSTFFFLQRITTKLKKSQTRNKFLSANHHFHHSLFFATLSNQQPPTYVRSALSGDLLPYEKGWAWQQCVLHNRLQAQRYKKQGKAAHSHDDLVSNQTDCDYLLFFEHEPVYTLGRGADENNLTFLDNELDGGEKSRLSLSRKVRGRGSSRLSLEKTIVGSSDNGNKTLNLQILMEYISENIKPVIAPNGTPIYRIERGGEVTFHGPGQLVVYPLLFLKNKPYKQDLHWYLRMVEEVVIQVLRHYGLKGVRDEINTGVWVNRKKIAAVGVSASKWITTHGFAINVSPDLSFFDTSIIIPCGVVDRGVTSISELMHEKGQGNDCPSVDEVADIVRQKFESVFGTKTIDGDPLS